ncbi:hypothetical protein FQN53_000427 [Emmonsiellopsis sp. PD_33]|nr:hypothetical protein FQN53_000427 [Emmonsiellopsis sp. PD_33]
MEFLATIAAIGGLLILTAWWRLRIPSKFPKNIPSLPFYVSLLGIWVRAGHAEIYDRWVREPVEKYGAVNLWYGGRWNVLVAKPEYLNDLFKNDSTYVKAGNAFKVPWALSGVHLGSNIISVHGETWKLYSSIMRPGIQKGSVDTGNLVTSSRRFISAIMRNQKEVGENHGVQVDRLCQQWTIQVVGENFLGTDFQSLENGRTERITYLHTVIKQNIFSPLFMHFPFLDRYQYIIPSRRQAFRFAKEFDDLLYNTVRSRPRTKPNNSDIPQERQVIDDLEDALINGKITEFQFRANVRIIFFAGHEDVQQLLDSAFYQLGVNTDKQDQLRQEVLSTGSTEPSATLVDSMPYLTSVVFELLRLYPPLPQLVNHVALEPSVLGGKIAIPAKTYIGWNAFGVQTNKSIWGEDAREFEPTRWGSTVDSIRAKFRRENARGAYIPFTAHARKCLGQGFALVQMKIVLFELVRLLEWKIDPRYKLKLTVVSFDPSSGFLRE